MILLLLACQTGFTDPSREFADPLPSKGEFPTVVHEPSGFGVLEQPPVGVTDREVPPNTACTTCHGPTPEQTWDVEPGEDFHGLEVDHGGLSCAACHDPRDRSKLHLADGESLEFAQVIRLCSQCHGTERRDFEHLAHGGTSGFWDRTQGAQVRNNCADCHAPHSPAREPFQAVFPPNDRYLRGH
jgi:hypothetical protein